MSIYAKNKIVDEITGEEKLVKHLNKTRVDRGGATPRVGGWNKSGKKKRVKKRYEKGKKKKKFKELKEKLKQ